MKYWRVCLLLLIFWAFYVMATGQSIAVEGGTDTGLQNSLVPFEYIRKHPNACSKEVCKRLFGGAQIIKLDNLYKPAVTEIDQVTKSTSSEVKSRKKEAKEEVMEEYSTGVDIILITSLLSLGLILVNLGLLSRQL